MSATTAHIGSSDARRRPGEQGGPPLWAVGLAWALLTVASVVLSVDVPRPGDSAAEFLTYQRGHETAMRWAAFLQIGSAIPLAIWSATVYRRLRLLGVHAPGTAIALAGGVLAAGATTLLGAVGWAAAETADSSSPAVAAFAGALSFSIGSAGLVPALALLVAGVAVPGLLARLLPRPLAVLGLVVAAIGMLSTFTMLTTALTPTLPVGRFGALVFLIAAGFTLPRRRPRAARPETTATTAQGVAEH